MSNRIKVKHKVKTPKCCGEKMEFKESYNLYICQTCGKEKKIKE